MADFRTDQATAFTQILRAVVLRCKAWGLVGHELVAIDGSQLKAVKSQRRHCTPAQLPERLPRSDAPIAPYRHDLDTADAEEAETQKPTAAERHEQIRPRRARKGRDEGLRRARAVPGQRQVSLTDPDRRSMPKSPKGDVGDTVQVAVAAKQQRFVGQAVTKAVPDIAQLSGLAIQAQEALEVDQLTAVAARGDSHGEAINAWEEAGIESDVAQPLTSAHRT
jgi:hypothetical protein